MINHMHRPVFASWSVPPGFCVSNDHRTSDCHAGRALQCLNHLPRPQFWLHSHRCEQERQVTLVTAW